jgi:hypothetical protein
MTVGLAGLLVGMMLQISGKLSGTWGGILTEGQNYNPVNSRWLQRYTSFLQNPNDFGLFMGCIALVLITVGFRAHVSRRILPVVGAVLALGGLALSSSRGGYLAFVVGFLYVAIANRFRGALATCAIVAGAAVALVVISPRVATFARVTTSSLAGIVSGTDKSSEARVALWQANLEQVTFAGLGYGGSRTAESARVDITDVKARMAARSGQTVDSGWLKLAVEEGILGLALLSLICIVTMRCLWRTRRRDVHQLASVAAGAVFSAYMFRSLSVDILDINPWNWLLWLLVGIAASFDLPDEREGRGRSSDLRRATRPASASPAAGLRHNVYTTPLRVSHGPT